MVSFGEESVPTLAFTQLQPKADFDCVDGRTSRHKPIGQSKLSRCQRITVAFACGVAGLFGVFIVGKVLKDAMVSGDATNNVHMQGHGTFMIPLAGTLSGPARPAAEVTSNLVPAGAPISGVPASMTPTNMGHGSSELLRLQAHVVELEHTVERRKAHQLGAAMGRPTPVHSNAGFFSALLAVMGMGVGWAAVLTVSGNRDIASARSPLAAFNMSASRGWCTIRSFAKSNPPPDMPQWLVYNSDGASRANGKSMNLGSFGIVLQKDGKVMWENAVYLGKVTNNVAEYGGIERAMYHAMDHADGPVCFRVDSMLVANQLNGLWKCKASHLQPYYERCLRCLVELRARLGSDNVIVAHVYREYNTPADAMANAALDRWDPSLHSGGVVIDRFEALTANVAI